MSSVIMLSINRKIRYFLSFYLRTQTRTSKTISRKSDIIIEIDEVKRFVQDCMVSVGTSKENACLLAETLAQADEFGIHTHGLNRLEFYINDVKKGLVDGKAAPKIKKETVATALVDGNCALGAAVAFFCTDLAIKKAKQVGVGLVAANKSAHYGIASCYTLRMMEKGLIGFTCTNTSPLMIPYGAKQTVLGSNPISLAAPGKDCDRFAVDVATTVVGLGKVQLAAIEGKEIPEGWMQDNEGKPITDPKKAIASGGLLPLGGIHEGAKGTGLAIIVEALTGILTDANYGPNIPRWGRTNKKQNLGQCFIAINIECFAPGYEERLSDLLNIIRNLDPLICDQKIMIPGDPEVLHAKEVAEDGGIKYIEEEKKNFDQLAKKFGVKPMKVKC